MRILTLLVLLLRTQFLLADSDNVTTIVDDSIRLEAKSASSPLIIVSWNMQWLSKEKEKMVIPRTSADYKYLALLIETLSPDILAFQEVDSTEAISALLPKSRYKIYLSDRQHKPYQLFPVNNQFTGFAIKSTLPVRDPPDLSTLNISLRKKQEGGQSGKLRYGSYLIVKTNANTELHLLNIHLKSGCFNRRYHLTSKPCRILGRQSSALAEWIEQRQVLNEHFIVLGDFNHQLNSRHQWLLTTLNKKLKYPLENLSGSITASCIVGYPQPNGRKKIHHYRSLVDHMLSSESIAKAVRLNGQIYQYQYNVNHVQRYQLSDHCPLVLHLPHM